jgi:hypothetical protein
MKQMSWLHVLLAAALVVAGGAALAFAAAPDVEKRVKVNINGDVESFQLEDFADGETRTFDAGAHTVTVTRNGDDLEVLLDGEALAGDLMTASGSKSMIWVSEDEDGHLDGEGRRVMILKGHGDHEGEFRTITVTADCEGAPDECDEDIEIDIDMESIEELVASGEAHVIHAGSGGETYFVGDEGGEHRVIVKSMGVHQGMVRYRCEETGSVLLVKEENAISDTFICPATGCAMERVEEPEVKVVNIKKTVRTDGQPVE